MWTWNRRIHLTNIYKTKTRWLMQTHPKSEKPKWRYSIDIFWKETLQSVLSLITPGCYWASLDLKDASYSVPVATLTLDGHYCNSYWWPNKCWAHIWCMCRKLHNINNAFKLTGVYYPSRQIYIYKSINTRFCKLLRFFADIK